MDLDPRADASAFRLEDLPKATVCPLHAVAFFLANAPKIDRLDTVLGD